jgi:hypothetical protein
MNDSSITSSNLVDKVGFKYAGSRSVNQAATQSDSVLVTIPHGLSFVPLCIGIYSDSVAFNPSYEYDQPPYDFVSAMGAYGPDLESSVRSDATNVYIYLRNWRTTRTMYYRTVGIIPPNATQADALPSAQRDDTLLNSDDNYLKIHLDTYQDIPITAFGTVNFQVSHNLGYRPMAIAYSQLPSTAATPFMTYRVGTENVFGIDGVYTKMTIDENRLYFSVSADFTTTLRIFYKVYLDA